MSSLTLGPVTITWQSPEEPTAPPKPKAGVFDCLLPALLASLPTFLDSLVRCLSGGGNGGQGAFNPGQRDRDCA